MKLEQKAYNFAREAHTGQFRMDGTTPYSTHPIRVVRRLKKLGIKDQDTLCAGYLHDTIEDCGITEEQLAKEFNPNIARIVSTLTRDVSRERYKRRIENSDYPVQIIKLIDTLDNVEDLSPALPEKLIKRKVEDCENFYISLAREIAPQVKPELTKAVTRASGLI